MSTAADSTTSDAVLLGCTFGRLGARERRVLLIIAQRILDGQERYGRLHRGKKNSAKETFEEACDIAVYTADAMMNLMEDDEDRQKGT